MILRGEIKGPDANTGAANQAGAPVARLESVRKAFGPARALDGLSISVRRGQILALLGPNGAGKTTAIGLLTGLRTADSGLVQVLGGDPRDIAIRRRIGVTPQETGFPNSLTVREVLRLVRAHYPAPLDDATLDARFPLGSLAARQIGGLSGGQKRALAVALAFAGDPELVFLDEPTTGLDVTARRALWEAIQAYRDRGGTVVLTTHYLEEAETLADGVAVVNRGRVVAAGAPREIGRRLSQARVRFRGAEPPPGLPAVERVERDGDRVTIHTADADALVRALVQRDVAFSGIEVRPASLEEAFVEITGGP